jgi:hypothetical protein
MNDTTAPCGRDGCRERLICCRPDCPLVILEIEMGLQRIYTRDEFTMTLPHGVPERERSKRG